MIEFGLLILVLYIIGSIWAFIDGMTEASFSKVKLFNTPAKIIFPAYAIGAILDKFFSVELY